MNDAHQEMSPDFVLMRLVSAAEYDRLDEPDDLMSGGGGFGPVKAVLGHHSGGFDLDSSGPSAGLGSASPHYSSPLPGKGELDGGLVLTQASPGSEAPLSPPPPEDFANLLRSGDRILECGLEQPPPGFLQEEAERQRQQLDSGSAAAATASPVAPGPQTRVPDSSAGDPGSGPESGSVLGHQHRLLTDRLAKWPQGLLDQALRLGLLEPRKTCSAGGEDTVLALARRLGQLGEGREGGGEGGGGEEMVLSLTRCSCLGSEEVGGLGESGDRGGGGMGDAEKGERAGGVGGGGTSGGAGPVFSSGTLSGLMRQVHRLAEEAGVCTDQSCRTSLAALGAAVSLPMCVDPSSPISGTTTLCPYPPVRPQAPQVAAALGGLQVSPDPLPSSSPNQNHRPQHQRQSRSQPQSRTTTPKLGVASGGVGRSASPWWSWRGRTKSSSGGSGGLLDKRPSLASSTSSGGSLLDVWGSTCSNTEQDSNHCGDRVVCPQLKLLTVVMMVVMMMMVMVMVVMIMMMVMVMMMMMVMVMMMMMVMMLQVSRPHSAFSPVPFTPAFTGETVSLVDVDISRRGGNSLHPPTPPPPPRRSLSLLDDFGGAPPQQQGPFTERSLGASMQSLPPRPLALPPPLNTIQHSLSLNGLPRPAPLHPDANPPPPRLAPRCPLGRPDASSFATSLRELEKVGTFSLWCHPKFEDRCHSVVEFIERAIMHSKNGKFLYFLRSRVPGLPPTPVQLLYPVSRFSSVKSLQHLCRFCIRQLVRIDHIQELPLPMPLISYLRKFYYYDPEEEISPPLKERRAEQSSQPGLFSFLCFLLVFLGLKNAQTFRLDSHSQPISSLRSLLCPAEFQMIRPPPPGSPIGSWGVNREGTGD
ncbi:hypothetical protein INR49_019342, partial [Caranx melampygus]